MGMKAKPHHHHHYNGNGGVGGGGNGSESSSSTSPSPPPSPRRHSSTLSHCRRKFRSKPISVVAGFLLLRRFLRLLVVLPLLYVSGLIMCVGPFSGLVGHTPLPGSVYRSHEMFELLWPHIQADNSTPIEVWLLGFLSFIVLMNTLFVALCLFGFWENAGKASFSIKRVKHEK